MFSVIRGGCYSRHASDFNMQRPHGLPHHVLLIIKTDSEITIAGHTQHCKPNSVVIIKPNVPYSYKNPSGEYIDDWLHFSCTKEDLSTFDSNMIQQCFPIRNTRLLTTYIQQLLWENNFSDSANKDYYIDTLFRILMKHLSDDFHSDYKEEYNPYRYKLQKLRMEIQAAPYKDYSAKEIANQLEISASYFQYLYKLFFNISFRADVINMKIDYSKELITCTTTTIEQIAYSCGYSSEVHFYRQFLAKTGMTPGEYRSIYSVIK